MVAVGGVFTVTPTVCCELLQPLLTVSVYTPEAAAVAELMEGFSDVEVNPFGPVQA